MHAQATATSLPLDAVPAPEPDLRLALRRAARRRSWASFALVLPLLCFLLLCFLVPIAVLLQRAVENSEVRQALPRTVAALASWDRQGLPPEAAFATLAQDLVQAKADNSLGTLARRLNVELPGARSVLLRTARQLDPAISGQPLPTQPAAARQSLLAISDWWGALDVWRAIARNAAPYTGHYLLASLDLAQDADGHLAFKPPAESAFRTIFARTFGIGLVVALACLVVGYPLAYWLAAMPERRANLVMILVLIPFWTSILVRVAAWIVLLQSEGLVNQALRGLGLTQAPLELLFNRFGVLVAMTHILLPFMILSLYSVMRAIPASLVRAAVSLGSHPIAAFWRVYVPQTWPGIGAGLLLVFILSLGYYITPALVGGPEDQLVSYYVAYYTNVALNWGMASALGVLLLAATLLLYGLYQRLERSHTAH